MIKAFRKVVLVVIAAAISMSFTACIRNPDSNNAEEITTLLEEKYGKEFGVKSIGNRLANDGADLLTAYCYPKDDEAIIFEAVMSVEKKLISDDYPVRIIEVETNKRIAQSFSQNGIKASANVSVSKLPEGADVLNMNLKQLISAYPKLSVTFTTIVCDGADARKVYDTVVSLLSDFYSGDSEMLLGTTIWKYDESSYDACLSEMSSIPNIGKTALEQHGPKSKVNIAMDEGQINTQYEVFCKAF